MHDLLGDLRYSARTLIKSPAFSTITVVTLALAIGVNTAIFSMVSVVFFSDIPIRDGDTASFFYLQNPGRGMSRQLMSMPEFLEYREGITAFEAMAAMRDQSAILTGGEEPVRVAVVATTANVFEVWGTLPSVGRPFNAGENEPGAAPVAILSDGFWRRHLAADPEVVGDTIALDGRAATIVGIMGPEMEFGDIADVDVWQPVVIDRSDRAFDRRDLFVTARLAPDGSLGAARAEAATIAQRLERQFPDSNGGWLPHIQSFNEGLADDSFWTLLTLLIITVAFVMLIACSNVATMMMARSASRSREIAVRAAVGAGRLRLLRQLVIEGALLSLIAGSIGLVVARLSLDGLMWMAGDNAGISSFFRMLRIDRPVLLFTLTVALLSPLLFSLLPALRATRHGLTETLREAGARASAGGNTMRGRRFLVSTQVALALALMMVAGLLVRSMVSLRSLDLGYDGDRLLTMRIDLPETKYGNDAQQLAFFARVVERLRAHPEVEAAAWVSRRPMANPAGSTAFHVSGRPQEDTANLPWAGVVTADPGYTALLNRPLLRGRGLEAGDVAESLPVALINAETARRYWPEQDPVGASIRLAADARTERWLEVVGVVTNDLPTDPSTPPLPMIFVPLQQNPRSGMALIVRPRGDAFAAAPMVRELIWDVDADQPVSDVRTMQQIFSDALAGLDAVMSMLAVFAGFAMFMASTGIYGVLSFAVSERTREFGIRMALGADGAAVRSMVMRHSVGLIVAGTVVGLLLGYGLGIVLASGIEGVAAADPTVFTVVAGLLGTAALISLYIPARRATRVDPIVALRAD